MRAGQSIHALHSIVDVGSFVCVRSGHCVELLRDVELSSYTMIGILGGDGTIHEALQVTSCPH